jgi:quercetin dioxygenase-like cupin family protein
MKRISLRTVVGGIALFAAGYVTSLVAQTPGDVPQRIEQKRADLSGAPGMEVVESFTTFKKGEYLPSHFHNGIEAALIVQGSMVQVGDKPPTMQETGTVLMNLRDARHGGYKVVGDTPLKIFAVHIVDKGKPLYDGQQ